MASEFRHPDGHSKRSVEIGEVRNHLLRIGSVNVRSHMIPLFPKKNKTKKYIVKNNAKRTIENNAPRNQHKPSKTLSSKVY